jgi:hypothetical protein
MTSLLDRLDEPNAESWIPEEGDKLILKVTGKDVNRGKFGDYVIVTGDVQPGSTLQGEPLKLPQQRAVHCLGTVLSGEVGYQSGTDKAPQGEWLDRNKVPLGSIFAVKYHGKVQGSSGQPYHSWKVIVEVPTVADLLDEPSVAEDELFG